ncbi:MAG TPA: NADH-quinone oxidoreductase subunit C [Gemmatimonadales bacterium]|nr:NADH-quinone oxidoreductase subunit C [Gemmatimonadales bacterium]
MTATAEPAALSPSVARLRARFGEAILGAAVVCGDTIVHVANGQAHDILAWLRDDPAEQFNYLTDITAVEYRDPELPLEVVYQLRSLDRKADLRVKIPLDPTKDLEVATVWDLWKGADWLEREAYDMFGVVFTGHPDLRRLLMWETYVEGYPLRKSFPLRGHFNRAEQTRQALGANPEAHYSMEELSIAEAYTELPADMRERLARGERGVLR